MKLHEEISQSHGDEEQRDKKGELVNLSGVPSPPTKILVGYALTSKKKNSFLQPKLVSLARSKGVHFVTIEMDRPLSDQGPFDIILHKFTEKEWCQAIEEYTRTYPKIIVLDPPGAIQRVYNRQYMLEDVADLKLPDGYGKIHIPRQLVVTKDSSSIPDAVTKAGLQVPLVAKPLLVDGSGKSHELSLAYDQSALSELEPPLVLQEFVNHSGVLFKVYVIGESIKVVRRFSLPDISKEDLTNNAGLYRFPRVSCASACADNAELDPAIAELPPRALLEGLASELRRRLGLRLFNIDMIRQNGTKDVYFVIDINYFPGYGKMPEYEQIFTDFLVNLHQHKCKSKPTS